VGEFVFHNVGLRVPYGSTFMLAPLLGFAGLLIGEFWPGELAFKSQSAPALLCAVAALFGLALPFWYATDPLAGAPPSRIWMIVVALTAAVAACVAAPLWRKPILCLLPCCLIFTGLSFGPASDSGISYPFHRQNVSLFQSLTRIANLVDSSLAPERRIRFWYDQNEPAGPLFDSASSLYLWGYVDCTSKLPVVPVQDFRDIFQSDTTFVHLTLDPAKIASRHQILAARGVVTGNERQWTLPSASGTIYVEMDDVIDMSAAH